MAMTEFLVGAGAFLATYLIHSTLMQGGVLALCRVREVTDPWRETLWRTALVAPVLTAALSVGFSLAPLAGRVDWRSPAPTTPERVLKRTPATGAEPVAGNPAPPASPTPPIGERASVPTPIDVAADPVVRAAPVARWSVIPWLSAAWLILAALFSLRWLVAARAGRRMLARRRPLASGPAHRALLRLAERAGGPVPPLSACKSLGGPATLPSGEICLPDWALSLPADELEAMLAHEYAHVMRRDPWWLSAALCLEAAFWPQPMNRIARREIAMLAELHADAQAAEWTRDGHALARCLASCAERMHAGRMPVLAAAMARQGGSLSERVRKLISGSIQPGGLNMSRKTVIFLGAIALAMVLPSVAVLANKVAGRGGLGEDGGSHVSIHQDADGSNEMSVSVSNDQMKLRLKAEGDVKFAPDDSGLEQMGKGATLSVEKTEGGVTRKLTAAGTGDGIEYHFFVDGDEQPWNDEARAWFRSALPEIMRESAINAPGRVDYILAHQGHDGVLDEIAKIQGDYARQKYVEAYCATGKLPAEAYGRLVDEAGKIVSDYGLSKALAAIYGTQKPRGEDLARLIDKSATIGSDFEMRRLLSEVAADDLDDESVMDAYARAAATIGSDFELRQALSELVEQGGGPHAVALALPLADGIGSDYEMRQFLTGAAPVAATDESLGLEWLKAAGSIGSDYELRKSLTEFARHKPASAKVWAAMLETSARIGSDHECASFLESVAGEMPDDPSVRKAFADALNTIGTKSEHQRVARAAGEI